MANDSLAITPLLEAAEQGDSKAAGQLFVVLYAELHRLASRELARQGVPISISPTTLLHQAYIEIAPREGTSFPDRGRFMGYASRVMRGLIIDHVRRRQARKRGSQFEITSSPIELEQVNGDRELTRIGEILYELAQLEPALAQIVDLKFFCGFNFSEIAAMRGTSKRTVQRLWEKARIYLHQRIRVNLES
ncbi:MAG TPA: ECF-type sigma factor [Terriglobales bacterium]|nr:ECF-type sigma factor [Terriglobales bacterium]